MHNQVSPHALSLADLLSVHGGQSKFRVPTPGSPGSGPSTIMELMDKPQQTKELVKDLLGMPDAGNPGDTYHPATANPDGSVNPGRFQPPASDGPSPPMSW